MEIRTLQQKDLEQMSVLYEELLHGEKMTMEHMEKMFRKIQKRKEKMLQYWWRQMVTGVWERLRRFCVMAWMELLWL